MLNAVNFAYESGDDAESVDEVEQPPRTTRGCGIIWDLIAVHLNLEATIESLAVKGSTPRLKSRKNRGKTSSYYWSHAGAQNNALDSYEVTEEESVGKHNLQRNGSRGLSFNQVRIVDEMHALKITKPLLIIEFFIKKGKELHETGE